MSKYNFIPEASNSVHGGHFDYKCKDVINECVQCLNITNIKWNMKYHRLASPCRSSFSRADGQQTSACSWWTVGVSSLWTQMSGGSHNKNQEQSCTNSGKLSVSPWVIEYFDGHLVFIVDDGINAVTKCKRKESHAQILESHPVVLLGARVSVGLLVIKLDSWKNSQKFVFKVKADILNFCNFPQLNAESNKTGNSMN